jgi:ATP-dependent helicase/nuclease subunit A
MQPTVEQLTAIHTIDRPLVVEAGAGTGKTWVLTRRFLHLLDSHPDWPLESIVAITFTEKAAREMRSRIRRAIEDCAGDSADPHWRERQRSVERLQVSTVHSLCARLLRENAIDAGLDPAFEVLEETDATLLAEEAVRHTLAQLVEEEHASLALLTSLRVYDLREELSLLLSKRGSVEQLFAELPEPTELLSRWRTGVDQMRRVRWQRMLGDSPDLANALAGLPDLAIADPGDKLAEGVRLAQDGCAALERGDLAGAMALFARINRVGGKEASWAHAGGKATVSALLKGVQDAGKALAEDFSVDVGALDEEAAQMLHRWRLLWRQLSANYDTLKASRGALDFDDLELQTWQLLDRQPRPERLNAFLAGLNHLMVDEFQDTNTIQRKIVYALASPERGGRLFVVGDAKQSIYRFRQAQVSIFTETSRDVARITGAMPARLSQSFRSHRTLVDACNALFSGILQPLDGCTHADYEARPGPLAAQRHMEFPRQGADAPVEIMILPRKDGNNETINVEEARRWEALALAQRLLALAEGKFPVWDRRDRQERPFCFDDAAILFRATTNLPLYEEQFKAAGLPYVTVSGRGYYNRPEIQDLLALLAALYNRRDDLNLAVALRSPLFGLSDETLYRLRWRTTVNTRASIPVSLHEAFAAPPPTDQDGAVREAAATLAALWSVAGRVEVWRLLRMAIDRTGYEVYAALADQFLRDGGRIRSNVQKLLDVARAWGGASLSDFLRRVGDLRAAEVREGEALGNRPADGAVQLMSIHAAKGLEFPVVAVADLGRASGGGRGTPLLLHDPLYGVVCKVRDGAGDWTAPASYTWARWLDGQMEEAESKRLLYVAATRAADLLILSGQMGNKNSWLQTICETFAIPDSQEEPEVVAHDGFAVAVRRVHGEPEFTRVEAAPSPAGAALAEIPALARPWIEASPSPQRTVTQLVRHFQQDAAVAEVRPAVHPRGAEQPTERRLPGHVIGRIVHRALDHWRCLTGDEGQMNEHLLALLHQEGIFADVLVRPGLERCRAMLTSLRRSPLFRQIEEARRCLRATPFIVGTPLGTLHGVIDLLYQDAQGGWHLVDWKTEWVNRESLGAQAEAHLPQMAIYALAAQQALGILPAAALVFLNNRVYTHSYGESAVRQLLGEMGIVDPPGLQKTRRVQAYTPTLPQT